MSADGITQRKYVARSHSNRSYTMVASQAFTCGHLRTLSTAKHVLFFAEPVRRNCSDSFAIQMRAYATGSDGLAEASDEDVLDIVLPSEMTSKERARVET